ncbi:MAG: hypothetical protein RLZZ324_441 [Candidatus Parcubacteria bacterium]|jgi:drug/metabolite transporter (DMT)-like permease
MTLPLSLAAFIALYTAFQLIVSRSSGKIDPYLSSTLLGAASTVTPLALWLIGRATRQVTLPATTAGIGWSIASGAVVGIASALLVKIFETGAVSFATPFTYGAVLALTAMLGWIVFKEPISMLQVVGVICVAIGVGCLAYARFHVSRAA